MSFLLLILRVPIVFTAYVFELIVEQFYENQPSRARVDRIHFAPSVDLVQTLFAYQSVNSKRIA